MLQDSHHLNWRVGDRIVIAPSGWNPEEAEIRTIIAISGGRCVISMVIKILLRWVLNSVTYNLTGQVTLDASLSHSHLVHPFMEPSNFQSADPLQIQGSAHWWGDGGQMAPEVGHLSHNIVIQGKAAFVLSASTCHDDFFYCCEW